MIISTRLNIWVQVIIFPKIPGEQKQHKVHPSSYIDRLLESTTSYSNTGSFLRFWPIFAKSQAHIASDIRVTDVGGSRGRPLRSNMTMQGLSRLNKIQRFNVKRNVKWRPVLLVPGPGCVPCCWGLDQLPTTLGSWLTRLHRMADFLSSPKDRWLVVSQGFIKLRNPTQ